MCTLILCFFNCLVGCFSMIIWTPSVLSVLYACVLYFYICPCSAQLSMFHMERSSRNTLITIIIVKIKIYTLPPFPKLPCMNFAAMVQQEY